MLIDGPRQQPDFSKLKLYKVIDDGSTTGARCLRAIEFVKPVIEKAAVTSVGEPLIVDILDKLSNEDLAQIALNFEALQKIIRLSSRAVESTLADRGYDGLTLEKPNVASTSTEA